MKPIEDVREISALTYGFIASKALFAAVELDLFTKIAGGADTLSGIAEATGIAANRARTLLTTLKTVGLITEQDGRFANAPATATYLVAGGLDNPEAECLTPAFVEGALRDAGFEIETTGTMLDEITSVTQARRP